MAFLIPSYIQKRLLRYALSHFPVVDTETLDLEQLDIAWGKRSSVELRDVGLHVKKLSHMLHLPDRLQPTKARIVSVRITVPADIYSSGIVVDVQGIDIQVRLDRSKDSATTPKTPRSGNRARFHVPTFEEEQDNHLPTAQELAESFLNDEPAAEVEELEEAIQNAGLVPNEESDGASETSDDDTAGTGVALAVPAFLANFLKGVIDRLQMTISKVNFILDAELSTEDGLTSDLSPVSLRFGVSSVAIDGFTHPTSADLEPDDVGEYRNRRRIRLTSIYGDLVTEEVIFKKLEKVATASSVPATSSRGTSPRLPDSAGHLSLVPTSPTSNHNLWSPQTASPESSRMARSDMDSPVTSSRLMTGSTARMQSSYHSQDRFADASDDGHSEMNESVHESRIYPPPSLAASQVVASELEYNVEEELPFLMDDARSLQGYESQELDPFSALHTSFNELSSRQLRQTRPSETIAATAPAISIVNRNHHELDQQQPIDRSQPSLPQRREPPGQSPLSEDEDDRFAQSSPPRSESSGSPSERADALLAQSMLYSHEDAQSLYMSTVSEMQSEHFDMPGGWGRSSSSKGSGSREPRQTSEHSTVASQVDPGGITTPRPRSPSNASSSPESRFRTSTSRKQTQEVTSDHERDSHPGSKMRSLAKRLFSIDEISFFLPWNAASEEPNAELKGNIPSSSAPTEPRSTHAMPGAFSQYQSVFAETFRAGQKSSMHARFTTPRSIDDSMASIAHDSGLSPPVEPDISIQIGTATCHVDISSTRLLYALMEQMIQVWSTQALPDHLEKKKETAVSAPLPTCQLLLQRFTFGFMENVTSLAIGSSASASRSSSVLTEPMFQAEVERLTASNMSAGELTQINLDLQTFRLGYPGDPILSFDRSSRRQSISRSKILSKEPDVKIAFKMKPARGPELEILTVPVLLNLNLQKLDDRLLIFGGVSGILDLSSSVATNSTILASLPAARTRSGNVRFGEDSIVDVAPTLSPVKINARFYGAKLVLEGRACAVSIDTGTLAVAVREDTARVKIEHIQIHAPYEHLRPEASALTLDILKTDIRVLISGVEEDFESLVSLIEPSGDRYEDDDGFLLDMLKRQRKNGSVLRVEIADVKANVEKPQHLEKLPLLAQELGRLTSGVTKYLPEDDRPGILILPTIDALHIQANLDNLLGLLELSCEKIQIAYVGTPLLLGFKIGALTASRDRDVLLDPLLQLSTKVPMPAVMGRFIGNVPESRMKLKFFNLLVEYKIPLILAVLGISETETVEDLALSMAASIATLKDKSSPSASVLMLHAHDSAEKGTPQPLRLDIFIRDCAMGLNPSKSDAKSLFLFSQAQISADEQGKDKFQLGLNIKRASVLLIDDVETLNPEISPAPRPYDSDNLSPAIDDLTRQGFQPVASIWSLQIITTITKDEKEGVLIDVDVSNKLLTMETCADSQQTLAAVFGGLTPPLPKKREQMYRTHVVPIENMMASFTGEAFAQNETDAEAELAEDGLNMEDADQLLEDIPSNMDFVGSFYDPEDEGGNYNPSVLGSVNRLSSRLLAPSKSDKLSFADSIEEKFEHGQDNMLVDPSEDYLEIYKFKAPVRRWNSKTARLDPIYDVDVKQWPVKVSARFEQITWNLYDGYDWAATRNKIAQAVERVEAQVEQRRRARRMSARDDEDAESEIADMLFQSIWIAVPPNADERDLRRGINRQIADEYTETGSTHTESVDTRTTGGRPVHRRHKSRTLHLERSRRKISFDLQKVAADLLVLPASSEETQNSLALRVGEFEIYDHVPSSTWKKFLTYLHDAGERQMSRPMIRLDAITVKPVADLAATEMIIKANLLPIRLHVDQDALDFMTRFFEFKEDKEQPSSGAPGPYIARIEVNTIPVKLDYKPKKVDYAGLRSGSTSEFANFIILERAEFQLKRLILYGVQSPDLLQPKLKGIWTADVINNQLPTVLAGLSGIRPLVDVGTGFRDLVVVPMREYRKDGRVVRSIQKGAVAFAKTTTSELARLGAKVAIGTQTVLEGAEGLLSPSYAKRRHSRSSDDWDADEHSTPPAREEPRAVSNYADQPLNVVTGLRDAWQGLERDLATAKDAIIAIGGDVRDSGSALGAMGAVARMAPTIILRPAIGATRGVGMTLLGAGNMLDKDSRRKIEDKYKRY